jgi:hypothetical protein
VAAAGPFGLAELFFYSRNFKYTFEGSKIIRKCT